MESPWKCRVVSHFSERFLNPTDRQVATAKLSHQDDGYIKLIIHSRDGDDEAFLTLPADEIYAMACAEEGEPERVDFSPSYMCLKWQSATCVDIVAERAFVSVKEGNSMSTKIFFTVGANR